MSANRWFIMITPPTPRTFYREQYFSNFASLNAEVRGRITTWSPRKGKGSFILNMHMHHVFCLMSYLGSCKHQNSNLRMASKTESLELYIAFVSSSQRLTWEPWPHQAVLWAWDKFQMILSLPNSHTFSKASFFKPAWQNTIRDCTSKLHAGVSYNPGCV